jgi:predicted RNA-binding protein YlxR (DUF448 family)
MRTCIACGTERAKRELVRIVRTPEGTILADATGRRSGRGAYVCADLGCLEKGLARGQLARALETTVLQEVHDRIRGELAEIIRSRAPVGA